MIRWPSPDAMPAAFEGSTLQDWLPAASVFEALALVTRSHGRRTALAFLASAGHARQPRETSYADLLAGIARAANLFRDLEVGPNDVVAYLLPALTETHFVLWGAETAGIAMPINPLLQAEDMAALLRAANAKVLVASGPGTGVEVWSRARRARELAPSVRTLMRLGGGDAPGADADFATAFAASAPQLRFAPPGLDDIAAYFHTGGTTGSPRLVVHTHRNQLAAAYGGAAAIGAGPDDVMLNGLPLFHVAATLFGSLSMLLAGAKVVVPGPWGYRDPAVVAGFWRIASELRATLLGGVPTAFAAALAHDPGDADLTPVRASLCGAALTPPAVSTGIERVTGRPLREVYGMTECGGVICVDPVWATRVHGSAGFPVAFCEVQARRTEASPAGSAACAMGETGVLVVRGPQVSPGYLGGSHADGLFTPDGWLVTGDLGRVEADGRVFITGRVKDLIIRGGHNIDPAAIEDCLRSHPEVLDAAAVGMPDAYAGEVPVAYATLRPDGRVTGDELRAYAADRIAERPALPKFIRIVDRLPLTAVGKVFKPALRLAAAREHFLALLQDQPVSHVQVRDDPARGLLLSLRWTGSLPERAALVARLQAYAAGVEFLPDDFRPEGPPVDPVA